jgi:hypothetical protein
MTIHSDANMGRVELDPEKPQKNNRFYKKGSNK